MSARAVFASWTARRRISMRRLTELKSEGVWRLLGFVGLALGTAFTVVLVTFSGGAYLVFKDSLNLLGGGVAVLLLGTMSALLLSSLGHAANSFFVARDLWFWDAASANVTARFVDRTREAARAALPAMLALGSLAMFGLLVGAQKDLLTLVRGVIALFLVAALPMSAGILVAHIGGAILPAGKLRRVSLLGVAVGLVLGLAWFRSLRVEEAITEEGAARLLEKAEGFSQVGPAWLPHNLGAAFVIDGDLTALVILVSLIGVALGLALLSHAALYQRCRDLASDESPQGFDPDSRRGRAVRALARRAGPGLAPVVEKDLLAFLRDPAQWSQLVLLSGIALLYLINADALARGFDAFGDLAGPLLAGMHTALAAFIGAGLSVRFAFPQLGLEGPAVWMLECAPIDAARVVRGKFAVSLPIVSGFPILIGIAGGYVLGLDGPTWIISSVVVAACSIGLAAYGAGRGAVNPLFDAVSVSELAMGPGALSTMFTAIVLCGVAGFFVSLGAFGWVFLGDVAGLLVAAGGGVIPVVITAVFGQRALKRGASAFAARRLGA